MKWEVGDMTSLSAYSDHSFDLVFDKGALDALVSSDSENSKLKATQMFSEISRVLSIDGGTYTCISLLESFVLDSLLNFFSPEKKNQKKNWKIFFHTIITGKPSPFIPFFVQISKCEENEAKISIFFDDFGNEISTSFSTSFSASLSSEAVAVEKIRRLQEFHQMRYKLGGLSVGRFETIHFWSEESETVPRFTLMVLDAFERARLSCAVFMVINLLLN
jgi:hypothetical protein